MVCVLKMSSPLHRNDNTYLKAGLYMEYNKVNNCDPQTNFGVLGRV